MYSGPELPVIYENPRFDAATPTLKPVFDRAIRFGAILMLEWGTLTLIEDAPRYLKWVTVVIAVLILAVHESWPWLRMRDRRWYPSLMGSLILAFISVCAYAEITEPHGRAANKPGTMMAAPTSPPIPAPAPAPATPSAPTQTSANYLNDVSVQTYTAEQPIRMTAKLLTDLEKVTVFIETAEFRVHIGNIAEKSKNEIITMPIVTSGNDGNLYWGDARDKHLFQNWPNPAFIVPACLVIRGPAGEQKEAFILIRTNNTEATVIRSPTRFLPVESCPFL